MLLDKYKVCNIGTPKKKKRSKNQTPSNSQQLNLWMCILVWELDDDLLEQNAYSTYVFLTV